MCWIIINPFNPTGHTSKKVFIYKVDKKTDVFAHFLQI